MAEAPALTLADQALANFLCAIAVQRVETTWTEILLASVEELLPHVNRSAPHMPALCEAAGRLLNAAKTRNQRGGALGWARACLAVSRAAEDFLFWRAGLALDRWRADQVVDPNPQQETPHAAE
jgi:hypothetical protein